MFVNSKGTQITYRNNHNNQLEEGIPVYGDISEDFLLEYTYEPMQTSTDSCNNRNDDCSNCSSSIDNNSFISLSSSSNSSCEEENGGGYGFYDSISVSEDESESSNSYHYDINQSKSMLFPSNPSIQSSPQVENNIHVICEITCVVTQTVCRSFFLSELPPSDNHNNYDENMNSSSITCDTSLSLTHCRMIQDNNSYGKLIFEHKFVLKIGNEWISGWKRYEDFEKFAFACQFYDNNHHKNKSFQLKKSIKAWNNNKNSRPTQSWFTKLLASSSSLVNIENLELEGLSLQNFLNEFFFEVPNLEIIIEFLK
eukprot:gene10996-14770_t